MVTITQRNEDFYTEDGLNAIENRAINLCKIYNQGKFPFNEIMLGFGKLKIQSKEECLSRIKEICDLIGGQFRVETEEQKDSEGKITKKEVLKW